MVSSTGLRKALFLLASMATGNTMEKGVLDLHPREWVQVRSEEASPLYPSLILKTQREVVGKQVQLSIRKDFVMGRTFPSGGKG